MTPMSPPTRPPLDTSSAVDPTELGMASIASAYTDLAHFMIELDGSRPEGTPALGSTVVWYRPLLDCSQADIRINGAGCLDDVHRWLALLPPETAVMVCRRDASQPFVSLSAHALYGSTRIRLVTHLYSGAEMAKLWAVMDKVPDVETEVAIDRELLEAAVAVENTGGDQGLAPDKPAEDEQPDEDDVEGDELPDEGDDEAGMEVSS